MEAVRAQDLPSTGLTPKPAVVYTRPARKGPDGRKFSDEARNQEVIRLYLAGWSADEIGYRYSLTGTAIRRLLRIYGVPKLSGAALLAARLRRIHGIDSFDSDVQMVDAYERFREQRSRAQNRKIGWELTFAQWWAIWAASGQYEKRGRAHADSAVMARRGDTGPYSAENVYITTLAGNFVESHQVRGHAIKGFFDGCSVTL
jgi:hypothetical protein